MSSKKCKVCGVVLKEANYEKELCDEHKEQFSKKNIIANVICAFAIIFFISLVLVCLLYVSPIVIPLIYAFCVIMILLTWGIIVGVTNESYSDSFFSIKNIIIYVISGIITLIILLPINNAKNYYNKYELSDEILLENTSGHILIDGTAYNLYKDKSQAELDFDSCLVKKSNDDTNYLVKENTIYKFILDRGIIIFYFNSLTDENVLYVNDDVFEKIYSVDMNN